ncbi:glycosyltransferase [Candidatus Magnetaquiglobus chichijimensis]|uniref:glycosyltransferase n=1 Tax=Candidatus Magnetaquiglobus chichijimensis TaxID=3141448 RepID=UPI003B97537D
MSNGLPLFSVIMPCHRQHDYLHGAISSVLAQTESRWELLLVDDSPRQDLIIAHEDPRMRRLASGGIRETSCGSAMIH